MDGSVGGSLITAFDYVWGRLTGRLAGLTDDEYLWEPVPGCWSLRPDASGRWKLDGGGGGGPAPDPAPVTTIAWRLGHLGGLALGGFASQRFGDGTLTRDAIEYPSGAAGVPGFLEQNYRAWRDGMASLDDPAWDLPLGPAWGPYAESSTADLALHVLDEVVHHGAEVGVLRDLYSGRWHRTPAAAPRDVVQAYIGFPQGNPDERELLLSWLGYLRGAVIRKAEGVSDEDARWSPDEALLPLLGIVNHLTRVEHRYIEGEILGRAVSRSEAEFRPGPELTIRAALEAYREQAAATDAAVRRFASLTEPTRGEERADLRWVLLHLINETARHAGHGDATRALLDGTVGE